MKQVSSFKFQVLSCTGDFKKYFLLAVLFFSLKQYLPAQTPGYLGKHFSVHTNISTFPSFFSAQYSETFDKQAKLDLNISAGASADYIINRDQAIGASFRSFKTATVMKLNDNVFTKTDTSFTYETVNEYYVNFKTHWVGIYLKQFSFKHAGAIAPLGLYNKFEAAIGFSNVISGRMIQPDPYFFSTAFDYENYGGISDYNHTYHKNPKPVLALLYSIGTQSLFYNRLFLTSSIQLGFLPAGFFYGANKVMLDKSNNINTSRGNDILFHRALNGRLAGSMLFNINIGLGILLF